MARIQVDTAEWPLVCFHLPGTVGDDDVEDFVQQWTKLLERHEVFVVVSDTRALEQTLTARQRARLAGFYADEYDRLEHYCPFLASVMVTSDNLNAAQALRLMQQQSKEPFLRQSFDNMSKAVVWVRGELQKKLSGASQA